MRRASIAAFLAAALLLGPPVPGATQDSVSARGDAELPDTDALPVRTAPSDPDAANGAGLSGEALFLVCGGCHSLNPEEEFYVGPHLAGIVGRETAALADYDYSPALSAASFAWDRGVLFSWIVAAESLLPGTHMLHQNHLEPGEVHRLIDFLERSGQMQPDEQ